MSHVPTEDGCLSITPRMKKIIDQPGLISVKMGSEKLRNMFQTQFQQFDPHKLSPFACACAFGDLDGVKKAIETGTAPDLTTTQTPFQLGFITLAVLGAKCIRPAFAGSIPMKHPEVITHLVDAGAPIDKPDIVGHTALHHACTPPLGLVDMAKLLLEKGANVNAQTRYGEIPLFFPFQGGDVKIVDVLMEHGADLDIPDANGDSPRKLCLVFGPEVTAAVQRWERKRKGEAAPMEEKRCENCLTKGKGLKQCARCHVVKYCSPECQRAHWKVHKPQCQPFSAETTVTLKPCYEGPGGQSVSTTISTSDMMRQAFGLATPSTRPVRPGLTQNENRENKSMVIKIQIPYTMGRMPANLKTTDSPFASLYIYNKKRDFVCTVPRSTCPKAYDTIVQIVQSRGVGGAKAYFAAELKNPDELVVKTSQVLAEQPF